MSEPNPYQPPAPAAAPVKSTPVADGPVSSRTVETGRGWDWILEGFNLFKKTPGIWILNVVIFFVVAGVVSVVPIIGRAAGILLAQILMGGLMLGCRALEDDGKFEIEHLFEFAGHKLGGDRARGHWRPTEREHGQQAAAQRMPDHDRALSPSRGW